jgi:hypothetical protein
MKTAFEEELTDALSRRASDVPAGASERLRTVDYHPRRHLIRMPVAVGTGVAAGAATAGTVLAVVLGGATPAYAGWSATPASSAPTSTAAPSCLSTLSSAPPGQSGTSSTGTWQTLLSDVRGPFTITLLQNGSSYATCFTGPSFTEVNRITSASNGSGGTSSGELSISSQAANGGQNAPQGGLGSLVSLEGTVSGDLTQVLQNHLTTSTDGPYTFIDGRVADGITGVTLALDDGQNVVSTVADGWFVAWWPGSTADATSAQVTKASGTSSENLVPVSQMGMKMPFGAAPKPGQPLTGAPPVLAPGSCTTSTTTPASTAAPGVNCKSSSSTGGGAPSASKSGNSGAGNSGNTGSSGSTGVTGNGPTTQSNP